MGQGVEREEIDKIIEEFDDDQSGEIEFPEYLEMMRMFYPFKRLFFEVEYYGPARKYPEFSREEIDVFVWAFRDFDADDSGTIDAKELANVFKSMGQGVDEEEIEMLIEEFGDENTSDVKWPGFLQIMKGFYPFKRIEYEFEYYLPARKYPEFSRKEIDVFSLTFRDFDLDGSGSIDARELGIALKKMGQGATPEKLKKIIDDVDDNGNGEIEWVEYLQIMRNFYPWKLEDYKKKYLEPAKVFPEFNEEDIAVFADAFREYDLDGSGSIDVHELGEAFKKMGQGATEEKLKQIIAEVDDNGNGELEWPEFLSIMRKQYEQRTGKTVSKPPVKSTPTPTTTTTTTTTKSTTTTTTTTPTKSTTAPGSPSTTKTTTTTTTTPTKGSPTPVKNTTSSSTTSTSTATKPTTTTTTTQSPSKQTFGTAKPTTTSSSTGALSGSHRSGNQPCSVCGKTVYAIEAIQAMDTIFHKGCFRCQEDGCGLVLNLKTFKGNQGKIYCTKHAPSHKPTQLPVSGSLAMSNAANAPKIQKVQGIKKNERMTFAPGELQPQTGDPEQ
jgi:Ca2+-binding EF-hand superfamily protein